jgi:starch synthase (maltosyl-transferring)
MSALGSPTIRIVVRNVSPQIDGGRYPIKRTLNEPVFVEADIFANGQDAVSAVLKYRREDQPSWSEVTMSEIANDRWIASFRVEQLGIYRYTLEAWTNRFLTWWRRLQRKVEVGSPLEDDFFIGVSLLEETATKASTNDATRLNELKELCRSESRIFGVLENEAVRNEINELLVRYRDPNVTTPFGTELRVVVDPALARFGAWYEVFPRSCSSEPDRHGTLRDLADRLPMLADLGFDVVYLPPIHPIGHTARKGKNNSLLARPGDPGSPWAIGSKAGGHKSVHPDLGTLEDFQFLLSRAQQIGIQIALDIAFQCSPDHPYVDEHPEWFPRRLDGSIHFAEDPPQRYEDIYPFDFGCQDRLALWQELKSIFTFWTGYGVRVFRVDNPHTKPFDFWEWLINDLKSETSDLIFLAEGLTRPNLMTHLARVGFSQSYDYFPWRNTKSEITDYYRGLVESDLREFFRPNLWPNTPQLLPPALQQGGRPAFMSRLILAATLGSSYGIYGPAYEMCEGKALASSPTEYADSEQYELKCWRWNEQGEVHDLIRRLNRARRANSALQSNERLQFHRVDNDSLIAYSKTNENRTNRILTVVNLDPHNVQSGWIHLALDQLDIRPGSRFTVLDLLSGEQYTWHGARNYVALNPLAVPGHVFEIGMMY